MQDNDPWHIDWVKHLDTCFCAGPFDLPRVGFPYQSMIHLVHVLIVAYITRDITPRSPRAVVDVDINSLLEKVADKADVDLPICVVIRLVWNRHRLL